MANIFLSLVVLAGDGAGAWVDVSSIGPEKTLTVDGGAFAGAIYIEGSNDAQASAAPSSVGPFTGGFSAPQTFVQAWNFMRVRRASSGDRPGAPTVGVAGPSAISNIFAAMNVPNGDGFGTPTTLSGGGDVNTFSVVGTIVGQILIETSSDGTNFVPTLIFTAGANVAQSQNVVGVLNAARVRVRGAGTSPAPLVAVGSGATSGAAGGGFPGYGGTPPAIGTGAAGTSALVSRGDHTHDGVHTVNGAGGDVTVTAFPGFGGAPPAIAAAAAPGTATTASRSDHTHAGVHSVNGLLGDVLVNGVATLDTVNTSGAELSALPSASSTAGALAWVVSVGAVFRLQQSVLTVDHITVETANGKAGYQWVRVDWFNRNWAAQTAYVVDGQNSTGLASDENTGLTSASPLLTLQEVSRRLAFATIATGVTINVTLLSSCLTTDKVLWTFGVQPGAAAGTGLVVTGTPTIIYTGTVTSFAQQTPGPASSATDNQLVDSGIPVSYTASGLTGSGKLYQRTNGTAAWWFPLKDLGSKTLRMTDAVNVTSSSILALAANDTYTVSTLTKIYDQSFTASGRVAYVKFVFCDDNSTTPATPQSTPKNDPNVVYDRCTFAATREIGNCRIMNCGFFGAATFITAPGIFRMDAGCFVGTGSSTVVSSTLANIDFVVLRIHFQGVSLFLNSTGNGVGDPAFYDTATDGLVVVTGGAEINSVSGVGNAGKMIRCSDYNAVIGYNSTTTPTLQVACSSDPLPIKCGDTAIPGTSIAAGALPLTAEITTRVLGVVPF